MSNRNSLSTPPVFHNVLRTGTPAKRRWENTVAALLLAASALPMIALGDAVAGAANYEANAVASSARR